MSQSKKIIYVSYTHNKKNDEDILEKNRDIDVILP